MQQIYFIGQIKGHDLPLDPHSLTVYTVQLASIVNYSTYQMEKKTDVKFHVLMFKGDLIPVPHQILCLSK